MKYRFPKDGDERVVRKFLWFPRLLWNPDSGSEEYRWLEYAHIKQEWETYSCGWRNMSWLGEDSSL